MPPVVYLKAQAWSIIICWENPDQIKDSDLPKSLISHAGSGIPRGYWMRNVFNQRFKFLFSHHNCHMGTRLQYSQPEQKDDDECPSLQSCSLVGVDFWSLQRMNKKEIPFIDLNIFRDFLCVFLSFKWNNFRILMKQKWNESELLLFSLVLFALPQLAQANLVMGAIKDRLTAAQVFKQDVQTTD